MQSVIFFGSSPFSNTVLQQLISKQVKIALVVTKPDKPVGRHLKLTPNPVKTLALKNKLEVVESLTDLTVPQNTIGLVAAYGKIIPQKLIDAFGGQIYNIHPSLLPKYRGPSPLQQQILDGITETGVTIIQLDNHMDHGPLVAQETDVIKDDDTTQTLGERLFEKGTSLFISSVLNTKHLVLKEQDHSQATYTKLLTRQDGFVSWEEFKENGPDIKRKWRAYYPWPGVWSINPQGERVKL